MRVLGIDPGIERIGWGSITLEGNKTTYEDCGCITTPRSLPDEERLNLLATSIRSLLAQIKPDVVNIEKLFFAKNKKTALRVAQARGVILAVITEYGAPIQEFTPVQVKQGVTGTGRAEKRQVAWMVKNILRVPDHVTSDDTFDALALCLMAPVIHRNH